MVDAKPLGEWYGKFREDVEEHQSLGVDTITERFFRVEGQIQAIYMRKVPATNIFDLMRIHVVMQLAMGEQNAEAIASLEDNCMKQPHGLNFLLLYAAQKYTGNIDKAEKLLDKLCLPEPQTHTLSLQSKSDGAERM